MPAKSGKQYRFMQMKAHSNEGGPGPSAEVAREFVMKTPAKKRKFFASKKKSHKMR